MSDRSKIECTDATWNPVTGCSLLSRGCDHCYAQRFSERFRGVPGHPYSSGFDLTLRPGRLEQPLHWRRPRLIFVNSMSDLFHKGIPWSYVDRVFDVMERADWHCYQVLTKRSSLMRKYVNRRYPHAPAPAHIWFGASVEDRSVLSRYRHLLQTNAATRYLCLEPLLGPIGTIDLAAIDWVIASGESGPGARPMQPDWVREIRDQCVARGVPFFFKQWGGTRPKATGNQLDGRSWQQFPARPGFAPAQELRTGG